MKRVLVIGCVFYSRAECEAYKIPAADAGQIAQGGLI